MRTILTWGTSQPPTTEIRRTGVGGNDGEVGGVSRRGRIWAGSNWAPRVPAYLYGPAAGELCVVARRKAINWQVVGAVRVGKPCSEHGCHIEDLAAAGKVVKGQTKNAKILFKTKKPAKSPVRVVGSAFVS